MRQNLYHEDDAPQGFRHIGDIIAPIVLRACLYPFGQAGERAR